MIFTDFFKAVAQFDDPRFRRVIWRGVLLSIALLVAAYAIVLWALNALGEAEFITSIVGETSWFGTFLNWGGLFLMLFLSIWLMIPIASAITSMFLDEVADAVEARHYPHLPHNTPPSFWDQVVTTLNFLGILILANIVALVLSLFFPFLAPFIFWLTNGYLLGREYFQMAAMRRMPRREAKALFRKYQGQVWLAGTLMAIPLTIPLVGLFIPVLGAATFTHQFERLRALPSG